MEVALPFIFLCGYNLRYFLTTSFSLSRKCNYSLMDEKKNTPSDLSKGSL